MRVAALAESIRFHSLLFLLVAFGSDHFAMTRRGK